MATAAYEASLAGASVVHIHFRDQRPDMGHFPTWDAAIAGEVCIVHLQRELVRYLEAKKDGWHVVVGWHCGR